MRPYKHGNGRIQHRGAGARFRHSALADFGIAAEVCEACRAVLTRDFGAPPPENCSRCGAVIVRERCELVRKQPPRHLGPEDLADIQSGAFDPCGQPAVACQIDSHAARCAEHADTPQERSR